jgi:hypothetical protein
MEAVETALNSHVTGNWGDVSEEDTAQNAWALENGARLMSACETEAGKSFWILTEAEFS